MKIISFYSFKGGVGRTALLTNLGVYWASRGKVVVLVDMDLAAPGLSYSPLLAIRDYVDQQGRGLGMADLFNFFYAGRDPDNAQYIKPSSLLQRMLPAPDRPITGALYAIGAGEQPYRRPVGDDAPDIHAFHALSTALRENLSEWRVGKLAEDAPNKQVEGKGIDYLLIDSRSGFVELRDFSLDLFSDHIVLVSGLNEQNLYGLDKTMQHITTRRNNKDPGFLLSKVKVVFSPVPAIEDASVLDALEKGEESVRVAMPYENDVQQAPLRTYKIHYNPDLAIHDSPLILRHPRCMYAGEVSAISDSFKPVDQEEVGQDTRRGMRDSLSIPKAIKPTQNGDAPPESLPSALLAPPTWEWPYSGQETARKDFLTRHPVLNFVREKVDPERLFQLLSWSLSLSLEEKLRVLDAVPTLSQFQVEDLITTFVEERGKFLEHHEEYPADVAKLLKKCATEWAALLWQDRIVNGQSAPATVPTPGDYRQLVEDDRFWLLLAHYLTVAGKIDEAGPYLKKAIELRRTEAVALKQPTAEAIEKCLAEFVLGTSTESTLPGKSSPDGDIDNWRKLMEIAQDNADNTYWWRITVAQSILAGRAPNRKIAWLALEPLLDSPPKDAAQCFELGQMVVNKYPERAQQAEKVLRKAVFLDGENPRYQMALGSLLHDYLGNYKEAREAYNKVHTLKPDDSTTLNRLGNLLQDHFGDDDCKEAENVYLKALELDRKRNDSGEDFVYQANLAYLLLWQHPDREEDAEKYYKDSADKLHKFGTELLKAFYSLAHDKDFGAAKEHFKAALEAEERKNHHDIYRDDLLRFLHLTKRDGHGKELLDWFAETGLKKQEPTLYCAFDAYLHGDIDRKFDDLIKNDKAAAQRDYKWLQSLGKSWPSRPE